MKYRDRFRHVLINPTEEQIVERDPLIAFSLYLSGRVNVLCSFADEIIDNLDRGFSGERVDGASVERAESLMWFWLPEHTRSCEQCTRPISASARG